MLVVESLMLFSAGIKIASAASIRLTPAIGSILSGKPESDSKPSPKARLTGRTSRGS